LVSPQLFFAQPTNFHPLRDRWRLDILRIRAPADARVKALSRKNFNSRPQKDEKNPPPAPERIFNRWKIDGENG